MFFCDFCKIFENTLFIELLRVTTSGSSAVTERHFKYYTENIKMTSVEAIMVTLTPILDIFLSVATTLGDVIQNNLSKSWRFASEMLMVESIIVRPLPLGFTVIFLVIPKTMILGNFNCLLILVSCQFKLCFL